MSRRPAHTGRIARLAVTTPRQDSRRAARGRGLRAILPFAPGLLAWALVTGVAMRESGLSLAQCLGMTFLAYAGSAQLAALPLMVAAAPVWVIVLTAIVVNLRFVIYSLALRDKFPAASARRRTLLGYLTGDIVFVLYLRHLEREPQDPHGEDYFLGAALGNWGVWQLGSVAGILLAGILPPDAGIGLAGTIALIALVVPLCARSPALAGVLVAGTVAVAARGLPLRLGLLAGVVCGIAAAVLVEMRTVRREQPA